MSKEAEQGISKDDGQYSSPKQEISFTNVNYLGAIVFTIGCSVLVVNAVLSFLPFLNAAWALPPSVIYVEGGLSLASNALFLCGSAFSLIQTIRAERNNDDGEPLDNISPMDPPEEKSSTSNLPGTNADFSASSETLVNSEQTQTTLNLPGTNPAFSASAETLVTPNEKPTNCHHHHQPLSTHELFTRCIHETSLLATALFLCSSIVYFTSSIASIITIAQTGTISRWIRYPQLIAACGFAIASIMMMLQRQEKWWRPAWRSSRWIVNLWNLVGSAGFIFCACFGLIENVGWAKYQFGMSYLWGSFSFLLGSVLQYYKSIRRSAREKSREWA